MKQRIRLSILFISALMIASCTSIPISTIWKMSKLNPLKVDPKDISIAVVTHKAMMFDKDAVQIQMAYKTNSASTSIDETFYGQVSSDFSTLSSTDKKRLSGYQKPNQTVNIFSLSAETVQAMRALQKKVRRLKSNNTKGSGTLSVGVKDVCLSDPKVNKLTTYILAKFNQKEGYIVLSNGIDLLKQLPKKGMKKVDWICKKLPTK